jgi:4-amino-4-deoxy-L-arabinose transferase-like glycosyltransferase
MSVAPVSEKLRSTDFLWVLCLGLIVFFGNYFSVGLQPDAACYAGLSRKILTTGEGWLLSGTEIFTPRYYEHPPFFMQWGALVLNFLGFSDGAARAIGGIPTFLGFVGLVIWTSSRWGRSVALWTAVVVVTFGHFTKYASTSMMEAPLSVSTLATLIGTFEWIYNESKSTRVRAAAVALVGAALATASKGVAGFGAVVATSSLLLFATFVPPRILSFKYSVIAVIAVTVASLLPFGIWAAFLFKAQGNIDFLSDYLLNQVARSATSTRADPTHAEGGSVFFYFGILLRNGWPWIALIPWIYFKLFQPNGDLGDKNLRRWSVAALLNALAFLIPFSLVEFQLAHYIHPIYLPFAPLVAVGIVSLLKQWNLVEKFSLGTPSLRWVILFLMIIWCYAFRQGFSSTPNRGVEFAKVKTLLQNRPKDCKVVAASDKVAPYQMECFGLWYWGMRHWELMDPNRFVQSAGSVRGDPGKRLFWEGDTGVVTSTDRCKAP